MWPFNYNKKNNNINNYNKPKYKKSNKVFISDELATREKVDFTHILGYLPDVDSVLIEQGKAFDVYRKIMVDSQVRACVNSRKSGTKSLLWRINCREEVNSKESELIKAYYDNDIDVDTVNDAILNAPLFGFQPIEVMWAKTGNYITPTELRPKNQEWFIYDADGQLRLQTVGSQLIGEELPPRKFLTPRYNDIHNSYYNPYGDRLLSSCFWPATFKHTSYKWWVTFAEKYGMPYLVGKLPSGQDNRREEMLEELQNMVMDAVAVITDDSDIMLQSVSGTSNADSYYKLINACEASISKVILGQTLTTDGNYQGGGSRALGEVHQEVRQDIILGDKKIVERAHNQLIQWICEVNFGASYKVPTFELYEEEDVDKTLAERDEILTRAGVKLSKSYFVKAYGFEDEDIELVEDKTDSEDANPPNIEEELKDSDKELEDFVESKKDHITDAIINQFDDPKLRSQIAGAINPVMRSVKSAKDVAELLEMLEKLGPEMSTQAIEEQLTKIIFTASILGIKEAREDTQK